MIVPFFISHQGCRHQCIFCDQTKISGEEERLPSGDEILDRVASFRASAGNSPAEVAFYGGTFTSLPRDDQERLLQPLQSLITSGEVVNVRISTRPDALDSDTAHFLAGMGVGIVELGVQSMDDEVLFLAGRGHTAGHTEEANRILRRAGMTVGMQLMPGLPGDTAEKALASMDRVLALRPDFLRVYPALVIAGTGLAALYRRGEYSPLPLAEAVTLCKVMLHRALTAGVGVVRIGLQATAELERVGSVLAGPYHPAFRQLVESELCYDLLQRLIRWSHTSSPVAVSCAPARVSDITGQKRMNLERLAREVGVEIAAVRGDKSLSPLEIVIESREGARRGNMVTDLDYGGGTVH